MRFDTSDSSNMSDLCKGRGFLSGVGGASLKFIPSVYVKHDSASQTPGVLCFLVFVFCFWFLHGCY